MKTILLLLSLLTSDLLMAQCTNTCGSNLISNPGFETATVNCVAGDIQIYQNQTPVESWLGTSLFSITPPTGSTPDYFSPCAGSTNSANNTCINGNARIGLFTKTSFSLGREYVQAQLLSQLEVGKTYCFAMTVKSRVGAAGNLLSSCDGIGAWFHGQGLINIESMNGGVQYLGSGSTINAIPQIENPSGNMIGASCVTVTGTFCAQGNENWIVIGNFRDDVNTMISGSNPNNYMYIDDVQLFEVCQPEIDITASPTSINCGESSTLTVNSTFPVGTTYTWLTPAGNTLNGLGPHNVTPGTTETYTIVASYTNNCGLQTDTSSIEITVGPCGVGAILYDTILCTGSCHNLQAYSIQGGTAPYSVQWTDGTGAVLGNTAGPILVCPSTTSTYYFSATDIAGSTFFDSLIIQVFNYPTVDAGNDTSVCATGLAHLFGTTDSGMDQWLTLGGESSYQVSPLISTNYIYQANNNGCVSADTVLIIVNQPPQISVQSTDITCFGESDGTMTAVATGSSPFNYNWYITPGLDSPTISGLPMGWEWVAVTDVNGCISVDSALINQPTALQLSIAGDTELCLGESTTLTATVSGGSPGYTINWNNGSGSGVDYSLTPNSSGMLTISVLDLNGCGINETVAIQVNPLPTASFNAGIQLCAGTDTLIQNTSIGAANYFWSVNGQAAGITTDLVFNENNAGCYAIQLIAENQFQCSDTAFQSCAVEIQSNPISNVHPTTYLVFIDEPNTILFNNSTNGDSCLWYLNDQLFHIGCESNLSYSFPELGGYQFSHYIYNDFGCVDSSTFTIQVREGLIYYVPNAFTPDGDEFNNVFRPIFTSGFDPYDYRLEIFNRWGELLFESKDASIGWDGTYLGKMSMEGVYTWKITFKDLYVDKRYEAIGTITLLK